jgi:hypothetical protein
MPCVGLEPTIPASERAMTIPALERSATLTGFLYYYLCKCNKLCQEMERRQTWVAFALENYTSEYIKVVKKRKPHNGTLFIMKIM